MRCFFRPKLTPVLPTEQTDDDSPSIDRKEKMGNNPGKLQLLVIAGRLQSDPLIRVPRVNGVLSDPPTECVKQMTLNAASDNYQMPKQTCDSWICSTYKSEFFPDTSWSLIRLIN